MARPATGSVVERPTKGGDTAYSIRFRAYGKRRSQTLGTKGEGWSRPKAEEELENVLADVRRGLWKPHEVEPVRASAEIPTLHQAAERWLRRLEPGLRERTIVDYRWALELHVLPHLGHKRVDKITVGDISDFRAAKLREKRIAANAINKCIVRIASVLEECVEEEEVERNVAAGKKRRAPTTTPKRSWVEPEQLPSLLDSADAFMRPLIATLAGAGLRIGEACGLDWSALNLATGTLTVRESKTVAGEGREVDLSPALREELTEWRARSPRTRPGDPVFVSRERHGKNARQTPRNAQARLRTAVKAANKRLGALGIESIGAVTPHSLRRTFASLRAALRDDPIYIAEQLGHKDARFTFRVYQKAAKRREKLTGCYLEQFDTALDWAKMGTTAETAAPGSAPVASREDAQTRIAS
jgi:integrase